MAVQTKIVKITPQLIKPDKIKIISEVLQKEGVIAYPTETFYGLGANCFSKSAVQKIYQLKEREPVKPLPVVISGMEMMQEIVADIPHIFWQIADELWPGPLTIVLKASARFPSGLLGAGASIGIRLPALSWLRELIRETGVPITATSANISGEGELAHIKEVKEIFYGKVDLIVDGGETEGNLPSSIIDLISGEPKILREGAIPRAQLKKYLELGGHNT